ncbi:unnamed protein product [Gadus morhua 'NCC']
MLVNNSPELAFGGGGSKGPHLCRRVREALPIAINRPDLRRLALTHLCPASADGQARRSASIVSETFLLDQPAWSQEASHNDRPLGCHGNHSELSYGGEEGRGPDDEGLWH